MFSIYKTLGKFICWVFHHNDYRKNLWKFLGVLLSFHHFQNMIGWVSPTRATPPNLFRAQMRPAVGPGRQLSPISTRMCGQHLEGNGSFSIHIETGGVLQYGYVSHVILQYRYNIQYSDEATACIS